MLQLDQVKTIAVVGVSENADKYGTRVYRTLKSRDGLNVLAINPKHKELWGDQVWPDLVATEQRIDLAVFVVPPGVGLRLLDDVRLAGIAAVWLQPGAESEQVIERCQEYGIECIHDACIIVDGYGMRFLY
ncbi:MAG: hypothetical protein TR69_WS6001000160 [candidate division WS6 bacterium OLB20]|uniref:CoA-binding domain-containing protein n=1 Tax=candidate division WS6 bacterium OLB20 TaxID=1617426 RepID=A0A136M084_9BACT|nr:MAG: hypothetical protein TR69_WS6001000160 [candidate division WS6 bacterium OLB20]